MRRQEAWWGDVLGAALEIGFREPLYVRNERLVGDEDACQLMYISDIHLRRNRSRFLSQQVLLAATESSPDALLLGGDLVDQASELSVLTSLVESLCRIAPVYAVGGNHDESVGIESVRESVVTGGGQWIHDCTVSFSHRSRTIALSGPESEGQADADVRVLCAHNPRIWKRVKSLDYSLVLAGHLHGCQFVAFEYRDRLFPGAWFYPYTYLSHQAGSTRLVVSRGVSDLIPLRWRCPREVVVCHV